MHAASQMLPWAVCLGSWRQQHLRRSQVGSTSQASKYARWCCCAVLCCAVQVLILLETEEVVEQPWRRPVQGGGGGAIRRIYDEHLEITADACCTHFLFTIPPDAAASFQTPLLQLRWLLRFQFTASMPPPELVAAAQSAAAADKSGSSVRADWNPLQGRVEQLTWALPITVQSPPC